MKKLNITFCSGPDYAGNAKVLYEYMKDKYDFNYTWVVYNKNSVKRLKKKNINTVLIGSEEFKKYIKTTNVFFTTQGNLDGDKIKCKNAIYIELWHGIGPKPVGFAQKNPSKQDIEGYENISKVVDYFIVPNDFWKVVFGAVFKAEDKRIKSLGLPILDYFLKSNGKENLEKILNLDLKKYKKIIMYMPTFKQGFNHKDVENISNNIFNFENKYEEKMLNDFLKKNNYLLCVKKHPGETAKLNYNNMSNIYIMKEQDLQDLDISVNEIVNAFDLMITDYSSIGTEFLFLERPVLFAVGDIDEYVKNRGILFGDFEFWAPGPICKNINELMKETKKLLEDKSYYKKERIEKKKLWFGNLKDGGCEKICNYFFDGNKLSKFISTYETQEYLLMKKLEIEKVKSNAFKLELDQVTNSKGYKFLEKIRKIKNRRKK